MKALVRHVCIPLLILSLCAAAALAQTGPSDAQRHIYSQAELDQMLAPIALYPDSLLSQILMAATYPLEVVEAARWSRANPGLTGDDAVRAAQDRDWDPSVKSLLAFPRIITMMDEKLDWTERLGDAFLAQQAQVMDTVQALRRRAQAAGNLQSNARQQVESAEGGAIVIEPANPDVVYVPYYNPVMVYGSWWWPDYPPVYWPPWPGYYVTPGFVGFSWGVGVVVGPRFFFGAWDWHHHRVRIRRTRPFYYHPPRPPSGRRPSHPVPPPGGIWHHNPEHRLGVPYRNPSVRRHFRPNIGSSAQRRQYRGFVSPPKPGSARPAPGGRLTRPRPAERPNAFEGLDQGRSVRRFSERGRQSFRQGLPMGKGGRVPGSRRGDLPMGKGGRVPGSRRQSGGK